MGRNSRLFCNELINYAVRAVVIATDSLTICLNNKTIILLNKVKVHARALVSRVIWIKLLNEISEPQLVINYSAKQSKSTRACFSFARYMDQVIK